ncbi:hypothetical protein E2562_008597 [Oryza meyeriana var. granulata]|uniref:Uncharacterized protein n=1 Tax=Oryza meyeriana var. granulata TaxID=110450 RepID=A0A6G1C6U0_9ORYZ|nr:hypothetical protein E2562_008597 [Oryza meyeriana var. granulata]
MSFVCRRCTTLELVATGGGGMRGDAADRREDREHRPSARLHAVARHSAAPAVLQEMLVVGVATGLMFLVLVGDARWWRKLGLVRTPDSVDEANEKATVAVGIAVDSFSSDCERHGIDEVVEDSDEVRYVLDSFAGETEVADSQVVVAVAELADYVHVDGLRANNRE